MKEKEREVRTCPKCGKQYTGHPAISRTDNETIICSECGTREALEAIGMEREDIDGIIDVLRKNSVIDN